MPDSNPIAWPPAPQTDEPGKTKKPANKAAGWVSFGLAVLLLPVELWANRVFFSPGDGPIILGSFIPYFSPGLLGLWIGAIVTGITGRRSLPGKNGLLVSLVNLGVYVYLLYKYQVYQNQDLPS